MPDEKRYACLREWVLPGDGKPDFQMAVAYTPTDPAPPVAAPALDPPDNTAETRRHTGGAIDAPAFELVSVARRLGKLDDLAAVVANNQSDDERIKRERIPLRALIHIAQERDDAAGDDPGNLPRSSGPGHRMTPVPGRERPSRSRPGRLSAALRWRSRPNGSSPGSTRKVR